MTMSSQDEIIELSEISSVPSPKSRKPPATSHSPHFMENISSATSAASEENITPAKSGAYSYRDRLKERFSTVKKQAVKSAVVSDFRGASDRISILKGSVKSFQRENDVIESEMAGRRSGGSGDFEEYVFFCEDNNNQEEGKVEEQIEEEDKEWDSPKLFKYKSPEFVDYVVKMQEQDLLWQPKRFSISLTKSKEVTNRTIEDDGLYTANKPKIRKKDLILLHKRLDADKHIKWFDRDATLNTLETPYANFSIRPSTKPLKLTEYSPATLKLFVPCEEVIVHQNAILDLQILSLTFKHHPLFSAEHVLQQKLIDFYDTYQEFTSQNKFQRLFNRLEALRSTKERLEKQAGDAISMDLLNEVGKLREQLFKEGKAERDALKGVLQTWKAIKKLRERNGYSNTSIKLTIRKENVDFSQEKVDFEKQIIHTVAEMMDECNKKFQEEMKVYKEDLQLWKNVKGEGKEKPKRPQKNFSEIEIKQEVSKKFDESFKPPGEPKLHFEISYDNGITNDVKDAKEKIRRNCVHTTRIWLKMFCNDLEVCKTKHVSLSDRFVCVFEETYSIQLNSTTAMISVEVVEQPGALLKRKCGEIVLELPPENQRKSLGEEHFIKEEIVQYNKHSGVGSGVALSEIFSDLNLNDAILNTAGFILYDAAWDFEEKSKSRLIQEAGLDCFDDVFDKKGMINANKLAEWSENRNLDPEDPRNAVLCDYVTSYSNKFCEKDKKLFRLNPLQKDLTFCNNADIEQNIRFIVLQHRNDNVPEFSGMLVPNRLKEIPFNVLENYLQRLKNLKQDFNSNTEENVEVKRFRGKKFLREIFMNIFQKCRNSEDNICYEDVVDEKYLANFDLLLQAIVTKVISFFSFKSKIEGFQEPPVSKNQIEAVESETGNATVKIVVHLQSGLNIPCRNDETGEVRPFIVIECNGIEAVSSSADGMNCIWNEELILPLETTHADYLNPDSLNGSIIIRIFDERSKEAKSAVFLGSIDVPISAICNSQMEGFFKIKIPHLLTNYVQYHEKLLTGSTSSNIQQITAQDSYLLLKLFSTPSLPKLSPSMEEWSSNEPPYMKNHILRWNSAYNANNPLRKFSALVIDTNGKNSCITRYIRPLEPPQLNPEGFDVTAEQCARYVSTIPFTEWNKFYENVCLTSDQFLKLMVGSVLDHAIVLTCYLLSLNMEVWLLLGFGIPNGSTAYVLVRDYIKEDVAPIHYVFDVVSGVKYSLLDVYCPLQKIYCLINEHNIWGNLQRTDRVSNIRFDLTRRLDWSCLFDNKTPAPTNTVQTKLSYLYEDHVQELEMRIDKKIKRKVMNMRKMERTVWNHSVAKVYKNLMKRLEFNSLHGKSNREVYLEVKRAIREGEVNGYVFNTPYTKVSSMVKQLLKSVEHLTQAKSIEFATTVYVHPYPACVYSIWILFAAITTAPTN